MIPEYPLNTAIVCHDTGAANILIADLVETGRSDWRAFMRGPAEKLWNEAFPGVGLCNTLDSAIKGASLLVSGTGWETDIEHESRILARSYGVRSVAIIDHWVNYAERFFWHEEKVWPDEFWVTDEYALEIATRSFPGQDVYMVPNRYVERQLRDIAQKDDTSKPELLYVLEPIRSDWGRGVPGEFQALDYFVSHLSFLRLPAKTLINLKPHPSDPIGKYDEWIAMHPNLSLQMDFSVSITESLGRATWVAGCNSFALVLGFMAGRKCYCTLPPWAPACCLPQTGIALISDLMKVNNFLE